jgi:hypothetical protein
MSGETESVLKAVGLAALGVVALTVSSSMPASFAAVGRQRPPITFAHFTASQRVDHRWSETTRCTLGTRLLFVLKFKIIVPSGFDQRGWNRPSARILVLVGNSHPRVLFKSAPMHAHAAKAGWTTFAENVRIPLRGAWLGKHDVEYVVQNGHGAMMGGYLRGGLTVTGPVDLGANGEGPRRQTDIRIEDGRRTRVIGRPLSTGSSTLHRLSPSMRPSVSTR